jgi:hypothetical protein
MDILIRIYFFNKHGKLMYLYSIFHIFSIRFHIRMRQKCGLLNTIHIRLE